MKNHNTSSEIKSLKLDDDSLEAVTGGAKKGGYIATRNAQLFGSTTEDCGSIGRVKSDNKRSKCSWVYQER